MATITEPKSLDDILEIAKNFKPDDIDKIYRDKTPVSDEGAQVLEVGFEAKVNYLGYIETTKRKRITDESGEVYVMFKASYYPLQGNPLNYTYQPLFDNLLPESSELKKVHDAYLELEAIFWES